MSLTQWADHVVTSRRVLSLAAFHRRIHREELGTDALVLVSFSVTVATVRIASPLRSAVAFLPRAVYWEGWVRSSRKSGICAEIYWQTEPMAAV
jgi:hypothetical protein